VLLYGAGGHAKVVADIMERSARHSILGFLDDNEKRWGESFWGYHVLGGRNALARSGHAPDTAVILAIGANHARKRLAEELGALGWSFATAIHPSAQIGRDVTIGTGTVIMANAVVNPGTRIGSHVIINTGATVDHDCSIEDYAHVCPGVHLAGDVLVGEGAQVGIGASAIESTRIGRWSIVGAGATVVRDIPDHVTAVGTPARPFEHLARQLS
jgi:acetyltransferase EpsM